LALLGEKSFAFVALYKLFEELYYYLFGYPIAKSFGIKDNQTKNKLKYILTDPYIIVYFFSTRHIVIFGNVYSLPYSDK